jgi:hypothetical protein
MKFFLQLSRVLFLTLVPGIRQNEINSGHFYIGELIRTCIGKFVPLSPPSPSRYDKIAHGPETGQKLKRLQTWDARVHLTRDLKLLNQHDELYQITLSKKPKNVIFQEWGAPFFYPKKLKNIQNIFNKTKNFKKPKSQKKKTRNRKTKTNKK